jgi:hypothetical protein
MSNELRNKTKTLHAISLAMHEIGLISSVMIYTDFATIYVHFDGCIVEYLLSTDATESDLIGWLYAITGANS